MVAMKITAIPQLYRNLRRWREILDVLRRYGLADWLSQFPQLPFRDWIKDSEGTPLASHSREVRLRLALTELGPTFIKLGQVLASRPDVVGLAIAEELKRLHSTVPALDASIIRQTLKEELGERFEMDIVEFDDTPLATASIGQVHRGRLADGTEVAIKVQRPGIEDVMRRDLDVLSGLAQLAERVDGLRAFSPEAMVQQLTPVLRRELDFSREMQNLHLFSDLLRGCENIVIPMPIDSLCTRRVLVMTRLHGEDFSRCKPAKKFSPELRNRMAKTITQTYMQMIFRDGIFHADPHPGNLIATEDGIVGILDFGMIGRIDARLREHIEEMLFAIKNADGMRLTQLIRRAGDAPYSLDDAALSIDVSEFISTYGRQSVGRFNLTGALNDLGDLLHRHSIKLPSQSAMLMKMLISLEGSLSTLEADFDALEIMATFLRRSALKRINPRRRISQMRHMVSEGEYLMQILPDQIVGLLEQTRRGEIQVQLDHRKIGSTVNRLVVGLIASALFLGSSLLLAMKVPPVMFPEKTLFGVEQISILGTMGVVLSGMMMMRLYLAINASGHLSRDSEGDR